MTRRHLAAALVAIGCILTFSMALALPLLAAKGEPNQGERKQVVRTVTIDATNFSPKFLEANVGDRIEWVNKDILAHTATAKRGTFDSKTIPAGQSWSYTATAAGQFDYRCTLHPTMKGTLLVH